MPLFIKNDLYSIVSLGNSKYDAFRVSMAYNLNVFNFCPSWNYLVAGFIVDTINKTLMVPDIGRIHRNDTFVATRNLPVKLMIKPKYHSGT
jgi:hypothetical protein